MVGITQPHNLLFSGSTPSIIFIETYPELKQPYIGQDKSVVHVVFIPSAKY